MKSKIRITEDVYGTDGEVAIKAGTELERNPQGSYELKEGEEVILSVDSTVLSAIDQGLIDTFKYEYVEEEI